MARTAKDTPSKLAQIPLFKDLSKAALERVAEAATEFTAAPGQVLVRPNSEASGLFLIEEGTVVVELRGGMKIELGAGECIGEMALLNPGAERSARVRAATEVVAVALRRDEFLKMLESEPKVAISMLQVLAKRLADADAKLARRRQA